ncbi:MAG: HD domain-containing protein [Dehalococcoidia bacterium]|jgi:putative nucleotidyltransferase with HDIG domain
MEQTKLDTIDGAAGDFGKAGLQYRTSEEPRHSQPKIVEPSETIPGSYLNIITSLVYALEAKDKYTSGHSRRVAVIAAAVAKELGLPKQSVDKIAITGLIHDIGKIGISESVLNKPDKLTNDEYQHVISHCEIGERILHPIIKDEEILDMVRHHHERYDGTGYPDGLSGRNTPLAFKVSTVSEIYSQIESNLAMDNILSKNASILAIADAYDAMISPRSYRAALSAEAAKKEIREGAGSQFDPEVAAALLRITDSLTPLFQEAQNRTGKEPERPAEEKTKLEADEAEKDIKIETQASKESERPAEEKTKLEAGEAKKATKVETQARKEATHDVGAKIYEGNVLLVVPPPVALEQARQCKEYLERVENLRILFFGASADEGFIIAVSAQKPETLLRILSEMSMVDKAIKKSEKQILLKLKDKAAH